jgi:hypothetical protein
MNMTMPKGFMSPKNQQKKNGYSDYKKSDIQDVVKSYFDKSAASPASPNLRIGAPASNSGLSVIKPPEIEPVPFSVSPQK